MLVPVLYESNMLTMEQLPKNLSSLTLLRYNQKRERLQSDSFRVISGTTLKWRTTGSLGVGSCGRWSMGGVVADGVWGGGVIVADGVWGGVVVADGVEYRGE